MAKQPPPDDTCFETYSDQSPESGSVPFWIDACVRMLKPGPRGRQNPAGADKVLTVAKTLDADRIRVAGSDAPEMDRADIAAIAGYDPDRPDSASWIVTFLQQVGYLQIQKRYEAGTGKRGADRFVVSPRPPLNYIGPRTKDGLLHALRSRTEWAWHDLFSPQNTRSRPFPSGDGVGPESMPSGDGVDPQNTRSRPIPSGDVTPRARSSFAPSGRSGGERPEGEERDTTMPAAPAAAGTSHQHEELDWARQLARDLPFSQKSGKPINPTQAGKLAARFRVAAAVHGYSYNEIQSWALDRIATSNSGSVNFVLNAFTDAMLEREPVSETLSLPEPAVDTAGAKRATTERAEVRSGDREQSTWCGDCDPARDPNDRPICGSGCGTETAPAAQMMTQQHRRALLSEQRNAGRRRRQEQLGNL